MLTVHNFITRPPQLKKQGNKPSIRLGQVSDQCVACLSWEVLVSQTCVIVREAIQCSVSKYNTIPKISFMIWDYTGSDGTQISASAFLKNHRDLCKGNPSRTDHQLVCMCHGIWPVHRCSGKTTSKQVMKIWINLPFLATQHNHSFSTAWGRDGRGG